MASQADKPHPADGPFPIVGVGASADGLDAFTQLLRHLPATTGMAYVLLQHLDPQHESHLVELLSKTAQMPVLEAAEGMNVQPDHVYVIPRNTLMSISGGILHLQPRREVRGQHMPIDFFFSSLAEVRSSQAIGVVLSGSGCDGTMGLQAIKAEGGITFGQDTSAQHSGMPRHAVNAGCVDIILPPEGIAHELVRIGGHPYVNHDAVLKPPAQATPDEEEDALKGLFLLLSGATRVDYANYKRSTVMRRIQRRMILHRLHRLEDYLALVRERSDELQTLHQDMLIHVTRFFRDAPVFDTLKTVVLPALLKDRSPEAAIRIWVPGCSTGEEVYSLAICVLECLGERASTIPLKVFATDVSELALERARAGRYLEGISADVSPNRLRRFFVKEDEGYQISKSVRDLCIFARHDMTRDPPFSNLDLISCRNVLIYLGPVLQKRVLPLFHYALKDKGFLLLGVSESIGTLSDMFAVVDSQGKFYVRKPTPSRLTYDFAAGERFRAEQHAAGSHPMREIVSGVEIQREADRVVIARYAPPGVVVNEDLEILQFRGQTGSYLAPAPGVASLNLLRMAREGLLVPLKDAMEEAKQTGMPTRRPNIRVRANGYYLDVSVQVIPVALEAQRCFAVLFETSSDESAGPTSAAAQVGVEPPSAPDRQLAQLQLELAATRDYMQSIIQELEASNEELKAANEEIVSSNEELQSTNEELQTAKEELQATNEELNTVNEQLQQRNREVTQTGDDLANLLRSVQIPIVMVGQDLKIRRFTPSAGDVFSLIPADVGRSIADIRPKLVGVDLEAWIHNVLESLTTTQYEVRDQTGAWYQAYIRPYRTQDNKIDGAVISVIDIDRIKRGEQQLRLHSEIVNNLAEGVCLFRSNDATILYANAKFEEMFGYGPGELSGRSANLLNDARQDPPVPGNEAVLESLRSQGSWSGEIPRVRKDGTRFWCLASMAAIEDPEHGTVWVVVQTDSTDRKRAQESLRESEERLRSILLHMPVMVVALDQRNRAVFWNHEAARVTGYSGDEVLASGDNPKRIDSDDAHRPVWLAQLNRTDPSFRDCECQVTCKDGAVRTIAWSNFSKQFPIPGLANWWMGIDVTERKRAEREIRQSLEERETLLREVHHRVKNNLQIIMSLFDLQSAAFKDPVLRDLHRESQNRIFSMAVIHEALYQSEDFSKTALQPYSENLCTHLMRSYGIDPGRIALELKVAPLTLDLERAVPFGLLVNELVSNVFKHAFPDQRSGRLSVEVSSLPDGQLRLVVADSGVGIPAGLEVENASTLGLRLVQTLIGQLRGSVSVTRDAGTTFTLVFPPLGEAHAPAEDPGGRG